MKKMSIAELRSREVYKLARMDIKNDDMNTIITEAKKLMNSFYRFCGLEERLLYLQNNEKTCNSNYTASLELKAEKWYKRLQASFKAYSLMLVWYGYLPTITDHEGGNEVIYTYFYN